MSRSGTHARDVPARPVPPDPPDPPLPGPPTRPRPAGGEGARAACRHNARVRAEEAAPARLCAVVKAGGYGHGAVPVARAALDGGAEWLAVALVEEGRELRAAGIDAPVLLLSEPTATSM